MTRFGSAFVDISGDFSPLRRQLAVFKDRELEINVTLDRASVAKVKAATSGLGGREDFKVRADVDAASFARARGVQALLTKESSKLNDVFDRSQLSIGQWTGLIAASLPIVFDLAGAVGALSASLGAATAGFGALGVGAGGVGLVGIAGIASVAGPAIASLGDLKTAQDAYTEAVERYGKGSSQAETALSKLAFEQKRAGPLATKLAENLSVLTKRWKALTQAGQTDFIGLLNDGVTRLNKKLPLLAESASHSMKALRDGFDVFLKKATGPEFDHFIEVMTVTFAKSIKPLAGAFGNIAKVLQRIAVAVAPDVVRMARGFEEMTQGWVESTKNAGKLREIIHGLVRQTEAWWDLLVAAKDLVVAALVPGMETGKKAVEDMTGQLKEWTAWVEGHPESVRNFFKEGVETTRQLAQALLSFLPTLVEISTAMRPIARAFLALVKGLNSLKIGSVSALTVLLGAIVATKLSKGVLGLGDAFDRLKKKATAAVKKVALLSPLGKNAAQVVADTPLAAEGGIGAQAAQGAGGVTPIVAPSGFAKFTANLAKFAKIGGGVAVAVTAVAGAFLALRDNFLGVRDVFTGFFEKVLKPLGDEFSNLVDELSGGHSAEVFSAIGAALGTIRKPAQWIVENLTKLLGIAALGAIFTGLGLAIATIVLPLRLAIKGFTLLIKGLKRLGDAVKDIAKFIAKAWIEPGVLIAPFRIGVKAALDIFRPMRGKVGSIAKDIGRTLRDVFGSAWNAVKDVFNKGAQAIGGIFGRVGSRIQRIAKGVRSVFTGLAKIIHKVADFIVHAVDRMVGALGSIKDKIGDIVPSLPSLPDIPGIPGRQRGGPIPGTGDGDRVKALLEPGEFVVNKKAVERHRGLIEAINQSPSRFQIGGLAGPTGRMANRFVSEFGGSVTSGVRPGDPGFHGRGLAFDWVGGDWRKAATYANRIGPKLLEGIYSGGQGPNVSWDSGKRVSPSFWGASTWSGHADHIHVAISQAVKGAVGAALEKIKRIKIEGKGPIKDIAQGAADTMRKVANQYLGRISPAVGVEKGATKGILSKSQIARVWRSANRGQGSPGLMAAIALAESAGNPRAVGHDPGGTQGLGLWQITTGYNDDLIAKYGGRSGMFNAINNAKAAGDILSRQGLGAWVVYNEGTYRQHLKQGGVVAPYVGAFKDGGPVMETGLGMLHEGEHVIPKMAEGGFAKGQHRLRIAQRIHGRLTDTLRRIPLVDELIDVAQRLAGLTTSPGGSELSKGEVAKQVRLQTQLLRMLRNAFKLTKRGRNMATPPRRNEFDSAVLNRLKALGGLFRQSSVELVGLTGTSGRIFDTKLAIRELKATVPAGAEGLRIAELVEFAEALKFGAFKRQNVAGMPAFAQGGVVPGRPGQAVPIIAHAGEQVVPRGSPPVAVNVTVADGMGWLKQFIKVEVDEKDRRSASRYRAGVMRP